MPLKKGDVNIVLTLDSDGAVKGVKNFGKEVETTSERAEQSFGGIQSALIGIGAVVGLRELKSRITGLADEAAFAHQSMKVLSDVTEALGQSGEAAVKAAEDLGDGMFSVFDAATALRNLLASGLELPKAIELMETLKNSAAANRKTSLTLAQQIVSTTEGIRNQNATLTDNSGITKNIIPILREYAKAHGTTVDKLDDHTKALAIANGFIKEGAVFLGQYESQMQGYTGAQGQATVAAQNLRIEIGENLQPAMVELFGVTSEATDGLREFIEQSEAAQASIPALAVGLGVLGLTGAAAAAAVAVGTVAAGATLLAVTAIPAAVAGLAVLVNRLEGTAWWARTVAARTSEVVGALKFVAALGRGEDILSAWEAGAEAAAKAYTDTLRKELESQTEIIGEGLQQAIADATAVVTGEPLPFKPPAKPTEPTAAEKKAAEERLKLEAKLQNEIAALTLTGREFKERQLQIEIEAFRKAGIDRVTVEGQTFDLTEFEMLKHIDFSKDAAEQRAAIEKDLQAQIRALQLSTFDNDRALLAEQVEALRAAQVDETAIVEFESLRRAEIREDEAAEAKRIANLAAQGQVEEWTGATDIVADGFTDMRHSIVNDFDSLGDAAEAVARRMFNSFLDLLFNPLSDAAAGAFTQFGAGGGGNWFTQFVSRSPALLALLSQPGAGAVTRTLGGPAPLAPPQLPGSQLVMQGDTNIDARYSVQFSPDRRAGFDAVYRQEIRRSEIDFDERL